MNNYFSCFNSDEENIKYCFNLWKDALGDNVVLDRFEANNHFFIDRFYYGDDDERTTDYIGLFCPMEIDDEYVFFNNKPYPAFSDHWTETFMVGQFITATNLARAEYNELKIMFAWLYAYLHNTHVLYSDSSFSKLYDLCNDNVVRHYSQYVKNTCFYDADTHKHYGDKDVNNVDELIIKAAHDYKAFCKEFQLIIINERNQGRGRYVVNNNISIWESVLEEDEGEE